MGSKVVTAALVRQWGSEVLLPEEGGWHLANIMEGCWGAVTWVAVVTGQVDSEQRRRTAEGATRGTAGWEAAEKEVGISPPVETAMAEAG